MQPPCTVINGVNTPFLYFGKYKSTFGWHTEDGNLYSINYIHYGEPKFWIAIAAADGPKFEKLLDSKFQGDKKKCSNHIRHKEIVISPEVLKSNGIRFDKARIKFKCLLRNLLMISINFKLEK